MTFRNTCLSILFLLPLVCISQTVRIDTIPFTLSKKLLVFKGEINGQSVDFAFDTGAALGVANSSLEEKVDLIAGNGKKGITDANLQDVKLKNVVIPELSVGSFRFKNIKSVLHDMEYLQCNELYLLGMDIIGNLNWRINFNTKILEVSEAAFKVDSSLIALPLNYKNKRPITNISFGNHIQKKCLIDFGFSGIVDIPESVDINYVFIQKQQKGLATIGLSSAMTLTGLGKADTVKNMKIDSLFIGNALFKKVPAIISEKTDCKIGVGFFAGFCNQVILNHSTGVYYLSQSNSTFNYLNNFDARVTYTNAKLVITAKNLSENSTANALTIGEEIKSVDGKIFSDFKNNCEFLNGHYLNTNNQLIIEKLNGEKLLITRQQIN